MWGSFAVRAREQGSEVRVWGLRLCAVSMSDGLGFGCSAWAGVVCKHTVDDINPALP